MLWIQFPQLNVIYFSVVVAQHQWSSCRFSFASVLLVSESFSWKCCSRCCSSFFLSGGVTLLFCFSVFCCCRLWFSTDQTSPNKSILLRDSEAFYPSELHDQITNISRHKVNKMRECDDVLEIQTRFELEAQISYILTVKVVFTKDPFFRCFWELWDRNPAAKSSKRGLTSDGLMGVFKPNLQNEFVTLNVNLEY